MNSFPTFCVPRSLSVSEFQAAPFSPFLLLLFPSTPDGVAVSFPGREERKDKRQFNAGRATYRA